MKFLQITILAIFQLITVVYNHYLRDNNQSIILKATEEKVIIIWMCWISTSKEGRNRLERNVHLKSCHFISSYVWMDA